jgi:hypothetical protein
MPLVKPDSGDQDQKGGRSESQALTQGASLSSASTAPVVSVVETHRGGGVFRGARSRSTISAYDPTHRTLTGCGECLRVSSQPRRNLASPHQSCFCLVWRYPVIVVPHAVHRSVGAVLLVNTFTCSRVNPTPPSTTGATQSRFGQR